MKRPEDYNNSHDRLYYAVQLRMLAEKALHNAIDDDAPLDQRVAERAVIFSRVGLIFGQAVDAGYFQSLRRAPELVEGARAEADTNDVGQAIYRCLWGPRGNYSVGHLRKGRTDISFIGELAGVLEREQAAVDDETESSAEPKAATPRPKRGRRPKFDEDADRRLFEAWESGSHLTYEQLANEKGGLTGKEVRQAIERHKKRQQRAGQDKKPVK